MPQRGTVGHEIFESSISLKRHEMRLANSELQMSRVSQGRLCEYTVPLRRTAHDERPPSALRSAHGARPCRHHRPRARGRHGGGLRGAFRSLPPPRPAVPVCRPGSCLPPPTSLPPSGLMARGMPARFTDEATAPEEMTVARAQHPSSSDWPGRRPASYCTEHPARVSTKGAAFPLPRALANAGFSEGFGSVYK